MDLFMHKLQCIYQPEAQVLLYLVVNRLPRALVKGVDTKNARSSKNHD